IFGPRNVFQGNYVGVDRTGTTGIGGYLDNRGGPNLIGGGTDTPGTGAGNIIAGDTGAPAAINIQSSTGDAIEGNRIGIGVNGGSLNNRRGGIVISQSSR